MNTTKGSHKDYITILFTRGFLDVPRAAVPHARASGPLAAGDCEV